MSKIINRTVKRYVVMIKDSITNETLDEYEQFEIPDKKRIARKFIKTSDNYGFYIDIKTIYEKRSMSIEDFIKFSKLLEITEE